MVFKIPQDLVPGNLSRLISHLFLGPCILSSSHNEPLSGLLPDAISLTLSVCYDTTQMSYSLRKPPLIAQD